MLRKIGQLRLSEGFVKSLAFCLAICIVDTELIQNKGSKTSPLTGRQGVKYPGGTSAVLFLMYCFSDYSETIDRIEQK